VGPRAGTSQNAANALAQTITALAAHDNRPVATDHRVSRTRQSPWRNRSQRQPHATIALLQPITALAAPDKRPGANDHSVGRTRQSPWRGRSQRWPHATIALVQTITALAARDKRLGAPGHSVRPQVVSGGVAAGARDNPISNTPTKITGGPSPSTHQIGKPACRSIPVSTMPMTRVDQPT